MLKLLKLNCWIFSHFILLYLQISAITLITNNEFHLQKYKIISNQVAKIETCKNSSFSKSDHHKSIKFVNKRFLKDSSQFLIHNFFSVDPLLNENKDEIINKAFCFKIHLLNSIKGRAPPISFLA